MSYSLTKTSKTGWLSILKDIENATHSIDCELFILDVDDVGIYFLNALRKKSREGVKVRLLVDAGGSYLFYMASTLKAELRADGVELSFFNHLIPLYNRTLSLWYFRNHRRSIIIDKKICYTGGICFSKNMEEWRDTMIRMEEPSVTLDMERAFQRMWDLSEHRVFDKRLKPTGTSWLYVTNAPLPGKYYYYNAFIDLIRKAKKEIFLTTPYFVPDHSFFRALYRAQKRGVNVHLLIPDHSDHRLVDHAGDFYKHRLIKKGARIYRYTKEMIHSKTAVIDDTACVVGSMNLDNVSLRYNFEGGLIIKNTECINELRQHFYEDIQGLNPITLTDWHNRPWSEKVIMYLTWPIRKLL
jgi:cardiolipin synthase